MTRRYWIPAIAGITMLFSMACAHADVWGYVDAKGVAHFAPEKLDDRYELFFRGGQDFDTAQGLPRQHPTARPVAVPTRSTEKLVAFFEISPGYKRVKHHLREASRTLDIDYELLKALIATESGFDATAVSPKGAVGLMQVMPATAERYGVSAGARAPVARQLADPRTNIRAGTRYLRHLLDLFPGQLDLALAAYNAGEGAVLRAGRRIPDFPETRNYVRTVLQLYAMLKPPSSLRTDRSPARVRMQLPGGAVGRGNLPPAAEEASEP